MSDTIPTTAAPADAGPVTLTDAIAATPVAAADAIPLAPAIVEPPAFTAAAPWSPGGIVPTVGRIVHFVMPPGARCPGEIRPAIVTRVNPTTVNLDVFLDGANDDTNAATRHDVAWLGSANYDAAGAPGTWHWMPYQVQTAKAADKSVSRAEFDHLYDIVRRLAGTPGIKIEV